MPASPVPGCVRALAREPPQRARHQKIRTHTPVPERSVRPLAERVTDRRFAGVDREVVDLLIDPGAALRRARTIQTRPREPGSRSEAPRRKRRTRQAHCSSVDSIPLASRTRDASTRCRLPAARGSNLTCHLSPTRWRARRSPGLRGVRCRAGARRAVDAAQPSPSSLHRNAS